MTAEIRDAGRRIADARDRVLRLERFRRLAGRAEEDLARVETRAEVLEEEARREGRDVERLESRTLARLVHDLRGTRDEALRRERQEHLDARLAYDAQLERAASLRSELAELRRLAQELGDPEADYRTALADKRHLLAAAGGAAAGRVDRLAEALAEARSHEWEVGEALRAGEALSEGLERVRSSLGSAGSWGTYDLLGGGFISSMIKHDRIDEARSGLAQAAALADRFRRELGDIGLDGPAIPGIDSFTRTADVFFDNVFTDWTVQSRIEQAEANVREARERVQGIVEALRERLTEAGGRITAAQEALDRAVEAA
jgi:predicted  nucleic acid-binding Zn-ribbon protein